MGNSENSDRLYFLGFQVNADGDCSHEIKMLASSKKTITNLDSIIGTTLVAQTVKRLPTMQKTQVQSLGQEDLLEKEMAHSSILAWKIPWTEEPGRATVHGVPKSST